MMIFLISKIYSRVIKTRLCLLPLLLIAANGCDDSDRRKMQFIDHGKTLLTSGEYEQARQAFKNALQIDAADGESRFLLAETLNKQGLIQRAFEQYKNVGDDHPRHLLAQVRIGQILLISGKLGEASQLLRTIMAESPNDVEALVFKANVLAAENETDAAIVTVEQALRLDEQSPVALMMKASLQAKIGQLDQAIATLRQVIRSDAENDAAHLLLANLYSQHQMPAEAESELQRLIELRPGSLGHYQRLSAFYAMQQQLDRAERVLRNAISAVDNPEYAQLSLVNFLAEKRNLDVAMAELLPFIDAEPDAYLLRFKLADLQLKNGASVKAEQTLQEIIEHDGNNLNASKARNALAKLYLAEGKSEQAKRLVDEVLAYQPEDVDALLLKGQFQLAAGRSREAVDLFRSVLLKRPDDIRVLKLLASAHIANQNLVLAQENLQKIVALRPDDESVRYELLEVMLRLGRFDQVKPQIDVLLQRNPKDVKALSYLFKYRLAREDWDGAQQATRTLAAASEANAAIAFYLSGIAYQAEGKFDDSVQAFVESLKRKPDAIESLTQLIKSYLALEQIDAAVKFLKQTIQRDATNFIALNLLGEVYQQAGRAKDAERAWRNAIKAKPQWAKPYQNLAAAALDQKKWAEAAAILQQGLEATHYALVLVDQLAILYEQNERYSDLLALYETVYREHPDSLPVINNLAATLVEHASGSDSLERAASLARRLEDSGHSQMLDTVAWVAFKRGSYQKAQKILEELVHSGTPSALIYYHLGMVYYKQGQHAMAQDFLGKAISASQHFKGVNQAKEVLRSLQEAAG